MNYWRSSYDVCIGEVPARGSLFEVVDQLASPTRYPGLRPCSRYVLEYICI